jgi:hypothetical protein
MDGRLVMFQQLLISSPDYNTLLRARSRFSLVSFPNFNWHSHPESLELPVCRPLRKSDFIFREAK